MGEHLIIGGRSCLLHVSGVPELLFVQPTARHEEKSMDEELRLLESGCGCGFVFVAVELDDWVACLMPWTDDAVTRRMEREPEAAATLYYIERVLLPWARTAYGPLPCVLGGYSLGGLFALWASLVSEAFDGVSAVSPSVWIRGWGDFASGRVCGARAVYLSLGDREERARNRRMAAVGDCIRRQHEALVAQFGTDDTVLEWNSGGHFDHEAERMARGFVWTAGRVVTILSHDARY